jgi:hypothetical protein
MRTDTVGALMLLTVSNIFSKYKCQLSGACFSPYSTLLSFMILDSNRSAIILGGRTYTNSASGARRTVRDVQAVHDTVLTGSDAEDDTNDSEIGDGCVRLIEVKAMFLSISASTKAGLLLDDRTSRVSFRFQDQI